MDSLTKQRIVASIRRLAQYIFQPSLDTEGKSSLQLQEERRKQKEEFSKNPIRVLPEFKNDMLDVMDKYPFNRQKIIHQRNFFCDAMRSNSIGSGKIGVRTKFFFSGRKSVFKNLVGPLAEASDYLNSGNSRPTPIRMFSTKVNGTWFLLAVFVKKENDLTGSERTILDNRLLKVKKGLCDQCELT